MSVCPAEDIKVLILSTKNGGRKVMIRLNGLPCILSAVQESCLNSEILQQFSDAQTNCLMSDEQLATMIDPRADRLKREQQCTTE